jgi:DNA-binding transcriptional MerR regulator
MNSDLSPSATEHSRTYNNLPLAPFGSAALCRLSGLTASQIHHWYVYGILSPVQNATRGGARRWSLCNVIEATVTRTFAEIGFSSK